MKGKMGYGYLNIVHMPLSCPFQFDVVCQYNYLRASSNMVTEIGTVFGTFVVGLVSDR